jgi:predicted Fe-S protein YdhL (DUF1289 family)
MARVPLIQSPCPYQADLSAIMDGDVCRMCKRTVTDLTAMSDDARVAFFADCAGDVCVSYALPRKQAVAVMLAAAAAAMPMAAAAQEAPAAGAVEEMDIIIVAGGIKDPKAVRYIETEEDKAIPVLPVVYEDDAAPLTQEHPAS